MHQVIQIKRNTWEYLSKGNVGVPKLKCFVKNWESRIINLEIRRQKTLDEPVAKFEGAHSHNHKNVGQVILPMGLK